VLSEELDTCLTYRRGFEFKNQKKNKIIVLIFFLMSISWLLDTDRYIHDNIKTIDKADGISIVTDDKIISYEFDERLIDLLSYGGMIVKVYNIYFQLFNPYRNELKKIDISIRYNKGEAILDTADVFKSNKDYGEYIIYMNNVYWSTNSKTIELLELIE